jgi:hypothetical protein
MAAAEEALRSQGYHTAAYLHHMTTDQIPHKDQ